MRRLLVSGALPDDLAALAAAAGVGVEAVEPDVLVERSGVEVHQGVVAETVPLSYTMLDELYAGASLVVALDGVVDPRNLGAVLRVVESLGGDGVIVQDRNRAPLSAAAQKAAAGAAEWLPVASVVNLTGALTAAKSSGMWVVGLDADAAPLASCPLLDEHVVLVAGSEGAGMRRRVRETCDALVGIPVGGRVPSLNVATAVAVAAYEVVRRRIPAT